MVLELSPGSLGGRIGAVCHPPAFLAGIEYLVWDGERGLEPPLPSQV